MKAALVIFKNHGGLSTDLKEGVEASFAYSKHIDFRKKPTSVSVLPKTVKDSGSVVTGLITDMIQLPSGKKVAIDADGNVYSRSTSGTWTKDGTQLTDTAYGMLYNLQFDTIYVPGLNSMHAITNADGRFSGGSFTVNDNYITTSTDQSRTGASEVYTTTGAINEGDTHRLDFIPRLEPLIGVDIFITTKGTGDLIVTMHDQANNLLAQKTVANASLTNATTLSVLFDNPIRTTVAPNQTQFHFHVHHPSGTATTIGTSTASNLNTAQYATKVNRFVNPKNGMHPVTQFLQYMLIGNERYLSAWEINEPTNPTNLSYLRHKLVFPTGYECTSISTWTEYAVIGVEKRSTNAVDEVQDGRIYFWDGFSTNYNFQIAVPEGSPYSLFSKNNVLYWIAAGSLWAWSGGEPVKVFQFPNTDTEYSTSNIYNVNYPNMITVRNSILMAGFPSETNSEEVEHAVWSWGSRNKNYRDSFGLSYTMSEGETTNDTGTRSLRLGMVKSFGSEMYLSWYNSETGNYGVDVVNSSSDPFGTAEWQSTIIDYNRPDKTKQAVVLDIDFLTLPTDCTVTPKYRIDRGAWVTGTAAVAGSTKAKMNINQRFKEIQVGYDVVCTTESPEIVSVTIIVETLNSERD
jgi:hypothetical protein